LILIRFLIQSGMEKRMLLKHRSDGLESFLWSAFYPVYLHNDSRKITTHFQRLGGYFLSYGKPHPVR
jgi:hypothetical protein